MVSDNTRASDNDRNAVCEALDAALGDGQLSTEEHRERVSAATKATTLGELDSLMSDLQIHPAPAQPAAAPLVGRRAWIGAAAAVVVLLGAGLAWGLSGSPSAPSVSNSTSTPPATANGNAPVRNPTTTAPPAQMLNLAGVTGLLAQMRTQFGDTLGYQLNIYQDQAVVQRPDTANAHKVVTWVYRDGNWGNFGPTAAILRDSVVGDLSKFDVQAVLGVVQQAPQTLHVYDATRIFLAIESRKDAGLNLRVNVSDGALSGTIALGADGTVTQVSPPAR